MVINFSALGIGPTRWRITRVLRTCCIAKKSLNSDLTTIRQKSYYHLFLFHNRLHVDFPCSDQNTNSLEGDLWHYIEHLNHNFQDRDLYICYQNRLYSMGNQNWEHILACSQDKDRRKIDHYKYKNLLHFVLCKWN